MFNNMELMMAAQRSIRTLKLLSVCHSDMRVERITMPRSIKTFQQAPVAVAAASTAGGDGETVKSVAAHDLPNLPGKRLTAVVVTYAPGARSTRHHHAGSVWAYVLSGAIRSQNSATGPAEVYRAGESFFEPPGSEHAVSENASATEPASLLAIHIADDGAPLTTIDE
jgi:quercetin dioxygenase-like cupin family protein